MLQNENDSYKNVTTFFLAYVTDEEFNLAKLTAAEATLSDRKVQEATKAMQAITIDSSIEAANEAN